ncbi:MAG: MFS transporter, partial [Lysobacter sp.]|nr:MFS transporter [Lysobacter sp.]
MFAAHCRLRRCGDNRSAASPTRSTRRSPREPVARRSRQQPALLRGRPAPPRWQHRDEPRYPPYPVHSRASVRAMSAAVSASPALRPRSLWQGRALILAGIVLSAFTLRTAVTSLTPLLDSLGREFGFGPTMTGVFGMVPTAAFAVFGVLTPAIAHRLGLERAALTAMAMAALGLLARAFAADTWQLLAASAVALSGMGIGNVVLPPLVKRYFADRVGAVSSMYITVLQLGT